MDISSNYSITRLFIDKSVDIIIDKKKRFQIKLKSLRDFYTDNDWNAIYHILTADQQKRQELTLSTEKISSFDMLHKLLFQLGQYKQYNQIYTLLLKVLLELLPNLEITTTDLKIGDLIINEQIWNYILYIIQLSCGEKVSEPQTFDSEEEKQLYLAQKEAEEKLKRIKGQKAADTEAILKVFLSITYSFPSLTFDFLFNQTMAQIQWLQKYAAEAVSYEVHAQAYAAGNTKKGDKLTFFTDK